MEGAFFAAQSKRAIARIAHCRIELADQALERSVRNHTPWRRRRINNRKRADTLRWHLVNDDKRSRAIIRAERTPDPFDQRALEILACAISADGRQSQPLKHRADIAMFEFDRSVGTADQLLKRDIAVGFDKGLSLQLHLEHGKIVSDDQVDFLIGPVRTAECPSGHISALPWDRRPRHCP